MRKLDVANSDKAYEPVGAREFRESIALKKLDRVNQTFQSLSNGKKFPRYAYDEYIADAVYLVMYLVGSKFNDTEDRSATGSDVADAIFASIRRARKVK